MRLLYYIPHSRGGLADYAREQANALTDIGVEVSFLCAPDYSRDGLTAETYLPRLTVAAKRVPGQSRLAARVKTARRILRDTKQLVHQIDSGRFSQVLLASYSEYLAPIWAGPLQRLARDGVVFGAVVHDPVRDYAVGPLWWHRRSVAAGYSFLREAFVHTLVELDTVLPIPKLRASVIPHGVYPFPPARRTRAQTRDMLHLAENVPTLLSFGHVRDGKNLDLVLRALRDFPAIHLVIAGNEQSAGQRSVRYYRKLAGELGVGARCRWLTRYIDEQEVGDLFTACDLVLLTYSASFRSSSGVLNTAVRYRKSCLASGGEGGLESAVKTYGLGIWIDPDSVREVTRGVHRWLGGKLPEARWEDYAAENSWERNAQIVAERMNEGRNRN